MVSAAVVFRDHEVGSASTRSAQPRQQPQHQAAQPQSQRGASAAPAAPKRKRLTPAEEQALRHRKTQDGLDPMDPSSYSSAPRCDLYLAIGKKFCAACQLWAAPLNTLDPVCSIVTMNSFQQVSVRSV